MSLKIISVVCSMIVLFTTGQIATAGPTIPAAQNEMMEAMKSGDSARIQKAANALAAEQGTPGKSGKQNAPNKSGMPALSGTDRALIESPQGKQILANHMQLLKTNPREASDIESKAAVSKAASDWHKQNPKEKREPSQAEIYKPTMMIGANPQLRDLAIVEYEPERLRIAAAKAQELAREQAKSKTPSFDKLSPEEKLAVAWSVRKRYADAHTIMKPGGGLYDPMSFNDIVNIHNVSSTSMLDHVVLAGRNYVRNHPESRLDPDFAGGGTPFGGREKSLRNKFAQDFMNTLPNNPERLERWKRSLLEGTSGNPSEIAKAVRLYNYDKDYEVAEKAGKNGKIEYERSAGSSVLLDELAVLREGVLKREGCEWVNGAVFEKNPSTICDLKSNALTPTLVLTSPKTETKPTSTIKAPIIIYNEGSPPPAVEVKPTPDTKAPTVDPNYSEKFTPVNERKPILSDAEAEASGRILAKSSLARGTIHPNKIKGCKSDPTFMIKDNAYSINEIDRFKTVLDENGKKKLNVMGDIVVGRSEEALKRPKMSETGKVMFVNAACEIFTGGDYKPLPLPSEIKQIKGAGSAK